MSLLLLIKQTQNIYYIYDWDGFIVWALWLNDVTCALNVGNQIGMVVYGYKSNTI